MTTLPRNRVYRASPINRNRRTHEQIRAIKERETLAHVVDHLKDVA